MLFNKRKSQLARSPTDALVWPAVHVWVSWAASYSLMTGVRLCLWGRNPTDWLASCPSLSASRATELVATIPPRGPVCLPLWLRHSWGGSLGLQMMPRWPPLPGVPQDPCLQRVAVGSFLPGTFAPEFFYHLALPTLRNNGLLT